MRTILSRGVTMIELMVGIAILAVVVAIAVPSLRDFLMSQRVSSIGTEVLTDFQLARSEAISRSDFVRVTFQSNADLTCYTVHTARNNSFCQCSRGIGDACNGSANMAANTEIKTVIIPRTIGVEATSSASTMRFAPTAQFDMTGFGTATVTVSISDGANHKLNVVVSPNIRRPIICNQTGSTLYGFKPC